MYKKALSGLWKVQCNISHVSETWDLHGERENNWGNISDLFAKKQQSSWSLIRRIWWGSIYSSPFRKPSLQNTRSLLPFVWLSIWIGSFLFRLKSQVPETLATRSLYKGASYFYMPLLCMRNHIYYSRKPSLQNTRSPLPSLWLSIWGGKFSFRAVEFCKGIFLLS